MISILIKGNKGKRIKSYLDITLGDTDSKNVWIYTLCLNLTDYVNILRVS